jgi:uncharacterized alpha-E superfamily protein
MTIDIANVSKADVYAAAQDLGERLERERQITETLRAELRSQAARPCLMCALSTADGEVAFRLVYRALSVIEDLTAHAEPNARLQNEIAEISHELAAINGIHE